MDSKRKREHEQTDRSQGRSGSPRHSGPGSSPSEKAETRQNMRTRQANWPQTQATCSSVHTWQFQVSPHHLETRCGGSRQTADSLISKELPIMPRVAFRSSGLGNAEGASAWLLLQRPGRLKPAGAERPVWCPRSLKARCGGWAHQEAVT